VTTKKAYENAALKDTFEKEIEKSVDKLEWL